MEFKIDTLPQDFNTSIQSMERRVNDIIYKTKGEMTWILNYPAIYTCGASKSDNDLLDKSKFPIFKTNRGGKYTYHGPGQRIIYLMINLNQRNKDIKEFVKLIENIVLKILKRFGVNGVIDHEHHGVFVKKGDGNLYKIASIGLKFKKWVSYHGFSFNLNPNLEHYSGISPCGLDNKNVTSLSDIGIEFDKEIFDHIIIEEINNAFAK
tara:strand:- start:62 stop:685 length:624 start_codon:yes stop_codon:yes gene_type:complete